MAKTETYTCDNCGDGISPYGIGMITEGSLVIVHINVPDHFSNVSGLKVTHHLHWKCYEELFPKESE